MIQYCAFAQTLNISSLFSPQDGTKVFTASCDNTAKMWDLNSNQAIQIAQVKNTQIPRTVIHVPLY